MKQKLFFIIGAFLMICGTTYAQTSVPEWQASVNTIKALIKTNPQQADQQASSLLKEKKNKKNADLIVAIAHAFLNAKDINGAQKYLELAQKANKKNPNVSILEGDIALQQNDPGTACQKYEQAIYYDKNCFEAYIKYANVYRGANPEEAISKLEELKTVDPSKSSIIDKTIAKIYYQKNQFGKAAEVYSRFINTPAATEDDITKYAFALFLNHQFDKSLAIAEQGLQKNPRSAVFNRLVMYNSADLKHYDEAEKAANAFFNASDSAEYSYLDYKYYGYILSAQKKYKEAADAYQKALDKDSTQYALWKEMSDAYGEIEDYPNAISSFKKYYGTLKQEEKTPELMFELGILYYSEGNKLDVKTEAASRKAALLSADSIFAAVAQLRPESYVADLYRARTNATLDPDATLGLAKPYYEKVEAIILAKKDSKYNDVLLECYRYLGYYYYVKKQNTTSREYWSKILAIDPENALAKKALSEIK